MGLVPLANSMLRISAVDLADALPVHNKIDAILELGVHTDHADVRDVLVQRLENPRDRTLGLLV